MEYFYFDVLVDLSVEHRIENVGKIAFTRERNAVVQSLVAVMFQKGRSS